MDIVRQLRQDRAKMVQTKVIENLNVETKNMNAVFFSRNNIC